MTRRELDQQAQAELIAMSQMAKAVEPLDAAARARVMEWVIGVLGIQDAARTPRSAIADNRTATDHARSEVATRLPSAAIDEWIDEQDYSLR